MKKFWYIVLNIFTFGIPYAVHKSKAKKLANKPNDALTVSSHINFNVDDLITTLGGKDNIISVNASTISTIKFELKDNTSITKDAFERFSIKGFIKNTNQIVLLFGDNANAISDAIKTRIA